MAKANVKINLEYGYTLKINEDDTLVLTVYNNEGENLKFDGIKGNLMDASDFETHYTGGDIEYTAEEYKEESLAFLTDWGVDAEVAEAIVKRLTPWFEKYAISEEEDIARSIASLENMVLHRREAIKQQMHSIEVEVETITKANQRIEAHTQKVIDLNKDIESYENTIAKLKAVLNKEKFISVEPCYTGGGIYIFTGQMSDGNYFMADSSFFDVRILNEDPDEPTGEDAFGIAERNIDSVEWQEKHLVKDLKPNEAVAFFRQMLKWVEENNPNGNYNEGDMEDLKEELDTLKGDWR